jgi:iodotyrosine deiodinase
MDEAAFLPLAFEAIPESETLERAKAFEAAMKRRRTVRDFSPDPISRAVIEAAIRTAAGAPSGANQQPWTFVAISDPAVKARIRAAAEAEEKAFYDGRAGDEWLKTLKALGTDWRKPFLETARLPAALGRVARGPQGQALLRAGIGRDRDRLSHYGAAPGRACDAHPYAGADGLPERDLRPA